MVVVVVVCIDVKRADLIFWTSDSKNVQLFYKNDLL